MLEVKAEGIITAITRFQTRKGKGAVRFKLKCPTGNGKYAKTINVAIYSAESMAQVVEGRTVTVAGEPRAKSMIGEDGADFAWLEITGAKLLSTVNYGQGDSQPPLVKAGADIPF